MRLQISAVAHPDEIGIAAHSGAFIARTPCQIEEPMIVLGLQGDGAPFPVHLQTHPLTKHVLVAGTTGSGKTTTCLHLLHELARFDVPFLVIEPTNAEHNDYRSLLRLDAMRQRLQVFTLGDEETLPFRLNPFRSRPALPSSSTSLPRRRPSKRRFRCGSHCRACSSRLSIERTTAGRGWTAFQKPVAGGRPCPFPTLWDFYQQLSQVVEHEIEHAGEVRSNIIGASKLRVEALMEGTCGCIRRLGAPFLSNLALSAANDHRTSSHRR